MSRFRAAPTRLPAEQRKATCSGLLATLILAVLIVLGSNQLVHFDVPLLGYPAENDPCLLLRPAVDTLQAFSQNCTQLGCSVTPDPDKNCLFCPCHKGYFALDSGRPLAGPPRRPLPRITLEKRDGVV